MYTVFSGSREWRTSDHRESVRAQLRLLDPDEDVVIQGAAPGLDSIAAWEARLMDFEVIDVPADWDGYGDGAGSIRNGWMRDMLVRARDWGAEVMVYAFHDDPGLGRGTRDMVRKAREAGISTRLIGEGLCPNPDAITACFIPARDGRMLLQHRTEDAPVHPGEHGLFGGSLEPEESPGEALAREAREELGIEVPEGATYLGPHLFQLPDRTMEMHPWTWRTDLEEDELRSGQREGQGLGFRSYADLYRMIVPPQDLCVLRTVRQELRRTGW